MKRERIRAHKILRSLKEEWPLTAFLRPRVRTTLWAGKEGMREGNLVPDKIQGKEGLKYN